MVGCRLAIFRVGSGCSHWCRIGQRVRIRISLRSNITDSTVTPDTSWQIYRSSSSRIRIMIVKLLPLLLLLLLHQQVQAQRTLVSLTKKLKLLGNSEKKKESAATRTTIEEFDVSGKGFFSFFSKEETWETNDFLAAATTMLLVITAAIALLRVDGECRNVHSDSERNVINPHSFMFSPNILSLHIL